MLPFATPRKAFHHDEAQTTDPVLESSPTPFSTSVSTTCGLAFNHRENAFVDFKQQPLLPHMLSREGPALARGDVNGDRRTGSSSAGPMGRVPLSFCSGPTDRSRTTQRQRSARS